MNSACGDFVWISVNKEGRGVMVPRMLEVCVQATMRVFSDSNGERGIQGRAEDS